MRLAIKRTACAMLGLLLASAVSAGEVYSYSGGSFDSFQTSSAGVSQLFTSTTRISFAFTTAAPIAANATVDATSILSWSFSDGIGHTLTQANDASFQRFSLTTDASGAIQTWDIALLPVSVSNGYVTGALTSNLSGCIGNAGVVGTCTGNMHSDAYVGFANWSFGGSSGLGTWASSVSAVPEPRTALLLACGTTLFWLMRRRSPDSRG